MAIIRENARFGAAFFTLLGTGCLSTDEPLFQDVAAPEQRMTAAEEAEPNGGGQGSSSERPLSALDLEQPPGLAAQPRELSPTPEPASMETPPEAAPDDAEPFDPCGAPGLLFCDTFDGSAADAFPDAAHWQAELPGCGTHVVDASGVSVSGEQSLRTDGGGYPECMVHAELEAQKGQVDVFVRSWIQLGPEPELLQQYFSLLELGPEERQDEPELRVGLRPSGGSLCPATPGVDVSVSGLSGGPATDCTGLLLEAERWYCVQARVTREASRLSISLSVDGELLLERNYSDASASWNDRNLFFKVGRAAYGASAGGSVFHDDVAVGSEPIPCGP